MTETIASQYAGKCESNIVHAESITWPIGAQIYLSKHEQTGTWIKCTNKDCFIKQGGKIQEAGGQKFASSKFKITESENIYKKAEALLDAFLKKNPATQMSIDQQAQFLESMFKTLSSCYKP